MKGKQDLCGKGLPTGTSVNKVENSKSKLIWFIELDTWNITVSKWHVKKKCKIKWIRFAELDTCYVTVRVNRTETRAMQGNSSYFVLPRYCICYCVCIEIVYFKCQIHNEGLPGGNCCFLAFFKTGSKVSTCQISSSSDQPF